MEAETGDIIASAASPDREMEMTSQRFGWAEQDPEMWWDHIVRATRRLRSGTRWEPSDLRAIGISYQMHGLVMVDKNRRPLRPAIIWCDSRAVETGEKAAADIGYENCLRNLLNLPGNFTAAKLKWVMDHEPEIYAETYKVMLPGDYIAMKMTGEIKTTNPGVSEWILWDFKKDKRADMLLDYFSFSEELFADAVPVFAIQGELTRIAAEELGLLPGTKITYRAGDQPNNALSLNVLEPGEIAATAGTSGVVYGVTDKREYDDKSRVNTFLHVNHGSEKQRYGVLLCVSGAGILYSWLKRNVAGTLDYPQMNKVAAEVGVGSDGLVILPFGNGAERTLENRDPGASIHGLRFNLHSSAHMIRAAQEGIAFGLNYGIDIMRNLGVSATTVRAGYTNMFLSPVFAETFATITGSVVELYNTDGSQGAARGAGIGAGIYTSPDLAFAGLNPVRRIEPDFALKEPCEEAYNKWRRYLTRQIESSAAF